MKKIVLIDNGCWLVDFLKEKFEIALLVVSTESQRLKYLEHGVAERIVTCAEIADNTDLSGLEYEEIEALKGIQLRIENALDRFILDFQIKKSIYYRALSFWHLQLRKGIDGVVVCGLNHGLHYDGIAIALAKRYGIKALTVEPILFEEWSVKNQLKDVFLEFNGNYANNAESAKEYDMKWDDAKASDEWSKLGRTSRIIGDVVYKAFGYEGLEFFYCLSRGSFKRPLVSGGLALEYSFHKKYHAYKQFRKAQKALSKYEGPYVEGENYIFYAMHFEPEGSITARVTLENQLTLISMISQCLPKGWKLYVKEHPHQFHLNTWEMNYYMHNIDYIKSAMFYEEIARNKKVRIIDRTVNSKILLKNAKAVATMNGTISLEAIDYKKPVMLFAPNTTPLSEHSDYLKINSFADCRSAVDKIAKGFTPEYSNIRDVISKYFVKVQRGGAWTKDEGVQIIADRISAELER